MIKRMPVSRRDFLRASGWAVAGVSTGILGYTSFVEPHWTKLVRRSLPVRGLPDALRGGSLMQISDLHVGPWVSDEFLIGAMDAAERFAPDIVVITGDLITHMENAGDPQFARLADVLAHVPHGRLATLGILGNHDYGPGWSDRRVAARVQQVAERAGIQILRNEVAGIQGLDIIGVDDLWSLQADPMAAFAKRTSDAAIALSHNPDSVDGIGWRAYQGWVLAGHTHGGQCKPPFLPPPLLPVLNRRYTAGEVDAGGGKRLYINRGLGHLLKVRFNVRPEITSFTLIAG